MFWGGWKSLKNDVKCTPPPPSHLKKFSGTSIWPYGFLIWRSKALGAWGRGVEGAFRFFTSPTPSPRELTFRLVRSPTRFLLQNFTSLIQKAVWTGWKVGNAIILNFDIVKSARNNSTYKWYLSAQGSKSLGPTAIVWTGLNFIVQ